MRAVMRYFGRPRSGVVVVVRGVFHHRNSAHHLDEDDIAAYLDYVVPGHEEVVRRSEAPKQALFAGDDESEYPAAGGEDHVAGVSELPSVGDIHHLFCREFGKCVLLDIHIPRLCRSRGG